MTVGRGILQKKESLVQTIGPDAGVKEAADLLTAWISKREFCGMRASLPVRRRSGPGKTINKNR